MVTSCICYKMTFEEIKAEAAKQGLHTIEEIADKLECTKGCGMCLPYIQTMLKTGQTEFSWN